MIVWKDEYSVGNMVLDKQHMQLLLLVSDLEKLLQSTAQPSMKAVSDFLNDIAAFAVKHFEYEERLLKRLGYAAVDAQHDAHTHFVEYVGEKIVDAISGKETAQEMLAYLKHWWVQHILNEDMKYRAFVESVSG
jgi:hemerythrin